MNKRIATIVRLGGAIILSLIFKSAIAGQISETLPGNIIANADFRQGEANKPAIFLLHGFMSTYNLNIIQIMADELQSQGYSVLAPTLSLNINNRHAGANCEAVHTHTMASDVEEIGWWLNWLKNREYSDVIAVGFSTGSLQIALYLSRQSLDVVKKAVFISPAYLAGSPFPKAEEQADIAVAKKMMAENNNQLNEFHLSYCKGNFVAPAKVFLSYKEWTDKKLLDAILGIKIPYITIIGGEDHRFGKGLSEQLRKRNLPVIIIPGANHFFDSPYEFDFLDKFLPQLELH